MIARFLEVIVNGASQVQFALFASAAFFLRGCNLWTRKQMSLAVVRWSFGGFILVMYGGQYAFQEKWLQFSLSALALVVELGIIMYLVVDSLKTDRSHGRDFPSH